ncbi:MAG: tyrosine--tRNA ligase [Leptonema sp. (in: Bacteria)]|nr:tyrosine--tRNA ligase [Leptonema sp. (in: bacteria)]
MAKQNTNQNTTKQNKSEKKEIIISDQTKLDFELIKRGTEEILPEKELLERLELARLENRPLKIKAGFDPTAPDLHLGHTVLLRKLRHFQELGHRILFLIGDFTGMVGDPSGRSATRKQLTKQEVLENAKTYERQVYRILDKDKTEIVFNSKWMSKLTFEDVLGLTARYTVARMLERDDFQKRMAAGDSISMIEFMYPLMQGYDSVALECDVELGGTDQKFNLLVGRTLQEQFGQTGQCVITMPLLVGLDGAKKMSKSFGNYIGIDESPYQIFAKTMSVSDDLMWNYYTLLTDVPVSEMNDMLEKVKSGTNPIEFKKKLGELLVNWLHPNEGNSARQKWQAEKQAAKNDQMVLPPDTPVFTVTESMLTDKKIELSKILVEAKLENSISAIKRSVEAGSLKIGQNLETVTDAKLQLSFPGEYAVRLGKKKYLIIKG